MEMKKRLLALCLVLLMGVVMVDFAVPAPALAAGSFSASHAAFKVGSKVYKVGTTSTGWKTKLGRHSRKQYDACTAGCTSYMYTFSGKGVKVETLVKNKKESIIAVIITGKSIGTSRGLKVGATVKKMTTLYGKNYAKSGSTYTYSSGGKKMVVKTTSKNKVSKITLYQ